MPNFNIDKFKLDVKYAIEASAGTGKTYNVMQILTKLLTENKELRLKDILIVTYTEKATAELKNRTREKLTELLKESADEDLKKKLRVEILEVDNAPIYTFHSFCQRSIAEFGLSINKPSSLDMMSEAYLSIFINRFIRSGERYEVLLDIIKFEKPNDNFYKDIYKDIATSTPSSLDPNEKRFW